ncbi:NAD(P)-binding protein [Cylindrobasidium torrendii FP15055 ss-10]|uniref:NAD(P)-binding protein n=1 Tax=Cylindrobasidium torrendii FP15055 ss-10 TaxID=1314674 RepID=A0A0D7AW32_9AGAR|nr:NAD(P)-binding protein [Cylindrobasidium torrendii FP15055 ss-10]
MPSLQASRDANSKFSPPYIPVAVFVGGTSGCGEATVKALASHTGGRVHLIIVGRNRNAAEKTFASMPRPEDESGKPVLREFLSCDVAYMRNVQAVCKQISGLVDHVNLLSLSAGYMTTDLRRDETDEGIDKLLSMRYYHRFKFILELLPLLERAAAAGQIAHAMTMLTISWMNFTLDLDDLDMRKNYTFYRAAAHPAAYNDIMVEEFSKRHPTVAFTHITPGMVSTPGVNRLFDWKPMILLKPFILLLDYLFAERVEVAAEYFLYGLLHAENGNWYLRTKHGDDAGHRVQNPGYNDAVWEHSLKLTSV